MILAYLAFLACFLLINFASSRLLVSQTKASRLAASGRSLFFWSTCFLAYIPEVIKLIGYILVVCCFTALCITFCDYGLSGISGFTGLTLCAYIFYKNALRQLFVSQKKPSGLSLHPSGFFLFYLLSCYHFDFYLSHRNFTYSVMFIVFCITLLAFLPK